MGGEGSISSALGLAGRQRAGGGEGAAAGTALAVKGLGYLVSCSPCCCQAFVGREPQAHSVLGF